MADSIFTQMGSVIKTELETKVGDETTARTAAISAEETRATDAEAALQEKIRKIKMNNFLELGL